MKIICLVSHPRSGSTSLINKIAKNTRSSGVLEIFHPIEEVICQHLDQGLGKGASDLLKCSLGTSDLRSFSQTNLKCYLNEVASIAGKNGSSSLVFKIFPGHLKDESNLTELFSLTNKVFYLRRNTLHSYISNQKAIKVGTYANVDTSDVFIEFIEKEYIQWKNGIDRFFSHTAKILENLKISYKFFDYEKLYESDDLDISKLAEHLELPIDQSRRLDYSLRKQDSRNLATEKISNPENLIRFLNKYEIIDLNESSCIDFNFQL